MRKSKQSCIGLSTGAWWLPGWCQDLARAVLGVVAKTVGIVSPAVLPCAASSLRQDARLRLFVYQRLLVAAVMALGAFTAEHALGAEPAKLSAQPSVTEPATREALQSEAPKAVLVKTGSVSGEVLTLTPRSKPEFIGVAGDDKDYFCHVPKDLALDTRITRGALVTVLYEEYASKTKDDKEQVERNAKEIRFLGPKKPSLSAGTGH